MHSSQVARHARPDRGCLGRSCFCTASYTGTLCMSCRLPWASFCCAWRPPVCTCAVCLESGCVLAAECCCGSLVSGVSLVSARPQLLPACAWPAQHAVFRRRARALRPCGACRVLACWAGLGRTVAGRRQQPHKPAMCVRVRVLRECAVSFFCTVCLVCVWRTPACPGVCAYACCCEATVVVSGAFCVTVMCVCGGRDGAGVGLCMGVAACTQAVLCFSHHATRASRPPWRLDSCTIDLLHEVTTATLTE